MTKESKLITVIGVLILILILLDIVGINFDPGEDTDLQPFLEYHKERERELIRKDSIIHKQDEEFEELLQMYEAKDTAVINADKSDLHDLLDRHGAAGHYMSPGR